MNRLPSRFSGRLRVLAVRLPLTLLLAGAGIAQDEPERGAAEEASQAGSSAGARTGLAAARARVQALVQGRANHLAPFRPEIGAGGDPWSLPRNVPLVRVEAPWEEDDALWIQVPEHAWTQARPDGQKSLLFTGEAPGKASRRGWPVPFPQSEPPQWKKREDGGLELVSALAGGITVAFEVRPADRLFELRFGVLNQSASPLLETWVQLCSAFGRMGTLSEQSPTGASMLAEGAPIGWKDAGQDMAWIEARRDPGSGRFTQSCYFRALVRGEPMQAPRATQHDLMVLQRPLDAPVLAKSSPDGQRHVVLYSPCARSVMFNTYAPCCHADPTMDGIQPGETRWVVLYGLFYEGELAPLFGELLEVDRALRTEAGFAPE